MPGQPELAGQLQGDAVQVHGGVAEQVRPDRGRALPVQAGQGSYLREIQRPFLNALSILALRYSNFVACTLYIYCLSIDMLKMCIEHLNSQPLLAQHFTLWRRTIKQKKNL